MQLEQAGQLKIGMERWSEQRVSTESRELFGWWKVNPQLGALVTDRAETLGITVEPTTHLLTSRFLTSLVENSPMPPIHFENFVDQIIISQATHGQIPVSLQAIACLNYFFNPDTQLEHIFPIDDRTKRWERFTEELANFLLSLTQIGARPLLVFGVSDVLDFEEEATYAHSAQELRSLIEQNVSTMTASVQHLVDTLPVPHKELHPQVKVFRHSQSLAEPRLQTGHQTFIKQLQTKGTVDEFRVWLQEAFGNEFPYLLRLDPLQHHRQLLQMMALYAADNAFALSTAQRLFPEEQIGHVTSLSLQPTHAPEWIAEKVACDASGIHLTQLTPFRNAGKWWIKRQEPSRFSLQSSQRTDREDILKHGATGVIQKLRRLSDAALLPDVSTQQLNTDDIFLLRHLRVQDIAGALLGNDAAQKASHTLENSRIRRQSK